MAEGLRAFALHDQDGSITTLITGPADGPPATVAGDVDEVVAEVSLTESGIDLGELDTEDRAAEVLRQYRIEDEKMVRAVRETE